MPPVSFDRGPVKIPPLGRRRAIQGGSPIMPKPRIRENDGKVNRNRLTGQPKPKCGLVRVCEYPYRDPRAREVFTKIRFRHDPCICGRGKSFMYRWHPAHLKEFDYVYRKPPDADTYLYRLDEIYPSIACGDGQPIYWTEGEKDADALASRYKILATSHHQGAGKATLAQASWLANAKRVVIVADLDDPGAYCAAWRHDLLLEVGCKGQIDIVRARAGNDAADHIAAGYRLQELVEADRSMLAEAARRYKSDLKNNHAQYMGGSDV
jgi:hypothetical protein